MNSDKARGPHITVGYQEVTRDAVKVVKEMSLYELEGTLEQVIETIHSYCDDLEDVYVESYWGYENERGLSVKGWRKPTEAEQSKIDRAWVREDARRKKEKEDAKAAAKAAKEAAAIKEREEYERLKEKFG